MIQLNIKGVENAYRVDDAIWRSAQPDDSAWPALAAAGCRAVIDLSNVGDEAHRQRDLVIATGMYFVALDWSGLLPPCQGKVIEALREIDNAIIRGQSPVLIHCQHGSDRTGTLCACWRIHHDGWSFEDAMEEAFTSLGLQGLHEFWFAAAVAQYAHEQGKDL